MAAITSMMQQTSPLIARSSNVRPVQPMGLPAIPRRSVVARAEKETTLQGVEIPDNGEVDSYQKIEAPVRGQGQGDGGAPMSERLGANDRLIIQQDASKEKELLGTEVGLADAMRFKGAAPEIINSRLAMLGFVAALGAELFTGKTIFEQFDVAPKAIVFTFFLFSVATLIPIVRGFPRKDAKEWGGLSAFTARAELINGRLAIIGFPALLIQEYIMKSPTFPHIF